MDCLFCQIAARKIPASIIYEDELTVAFDDLQPKAPHHKLIIPRKHIATLNDIGPDDTIIVGQLLQTASKIAKELFIAEPGYRIVMNCNQDAGQAVFHIHLHLLGGRTLTWPPG
ncbi:MAG: Purine nucleoside phosphoramidase [Legionellaceae bacterium]